MNQNLIWESDCPHWNLHKQVRASGVVRYELVRKDRKSGHVYETKREAIAAAHDGCTRLRCSRVAPLLQWTRQNHRRYVAGEWLAQARWSKVAGRSGERMWSLYRGDQFRGYYEFLKDAQDKAERIAMRSRA